MTSLILASINELNHISWVLIKSLWNLALSTEITHAIIGKCIFKAWEFLVLAASMDFEREWISCEDCSSSWSTFQQWLGTSHYSWYRSISHTWRIVVNCNLFCWQFGIMDQASSSTEVVLLPTFFFYLPKGLLVWTNVAIALIIQLFVNRGYKPYWIFCFEGKI